MTIGISPCPNDTFIFEGIYNQRIDLQGIKYEFIMGDVEELNNMAMEGRLDVTKISFNAFTKVLDQYELLHSGSALGRNCGPLLISKVPIDLNSINHLTVAIPGKNTTANLLLTIAYPHLQKKKEMIFHEIEDALLNEEVDLGLIIHENRFTYHGKGLKKVRDLGEYWEETYHHPIPLGGIAVKRDLDAEIKQIINRSIKLSIEYAFAHPDIVKPWIKEHSQEMDNEVIDQHIGLYVNEFSIDLGNEGRKAVKTLIQAMVDREIMKYPEKNIFLEGNQTA
ncbi:MAG: 1,4-dihydroxy-6-naphthoate synthase [Saprospiraceae bacterium]|nr:1,4-dihydroxy-6-naphthoate synthase [Saprospiraceae bacterium]